MFAATTPTINSCECSGKFKMMEADTPNTMELLNPGSISIYERDENDITTYGANDKRSHSHLEYLPPDAPHNINNEGVETVQSDELYKRVYELAETVQREINDKQRHNEVTHNEEVMTDRPIDVSLESEIDDDNGDMVIKIKKGIAKMKRLDIKLADISKKEKEIKKQRSLLESSNQWELDPSISDVSIGAPPVFPTQPLERKHDIECIVECLETETHPNEDGNESEQNENESQSKKKSIKNDSHFIARNKELAGEASQVVSMTEAEKKRLEELLEEEDDENNLDEEESQCKIKEGFGYSSEDLTILNNIDKQLEGLVPALTLTSELQSPTMEYTSVAKQPGEEVLAVLQEHRSEYKRLLEIDEQLTRLYQSKDTTDNEKVVVLTEAQLHALLEQYQTEQAATSPEVY